MKKNIVVLDADQHQCRQLCAVLQKRHYRAIARHTLSDLESSIVELNSLAVIIDIDTVPVDNRVIRELTLKYPELYFLCLSQDRFHPELKDAICYHIYACLRKPVDPEELFYFLESIYENEAYSKDQQTE